MVIILKIAADTLTHFVHKVYGFNYTDDSLFILYSLFILGFIGLVGSCKFLWMEWEVGDIGI